MAHKTVIDPVAIYAALDRHAGNKTQMAAELGVHRQTVLRRMTELGISDKPLVAGRIRPEKVNKLSLPPEGKVQRYILTSAQNNTSVHGKFLSNLKAYQAYLTKLEGLPVTLGISRFTYNKTAYDNSFMVKPGRGPTEGDHDSVWYDQSIADYVYDDPERHGSCRYQLAPDLLWCADLNIKPTAPDPISGLDIHAGNCSGIFPHAKVAARPMPRMKGEHARFLFTTGCCTQLNYIQRKEGQKAEFHHCFHPNTQFITDVGVKSFAEAVNTSVRVWSGTSWEDAQIRSFGVQPLQKITFVPDVHQICNGTPAFRSQSSLLQHQVSATPDHSWRLADGTDTRHLKVGDVVPAAFAKTDDEGPEFEEGVRHGLVFGDGSVIYRSLKTGLFSHQLYMHGGNVKPWVRLFDKIHWHKSREHIHNYLGTAFLKSALNFKELPPEGSSVKYLRGFLVGWIAADGHFKLRDKCVHLCSVTKYALEWALKTAPIAGYVATGFSVDHPETTTFGKVRQCCWRLVLSDRQKYWKVKSIEDAGQGEVMCAVVEPSHTFTLAGGILTGNCYSALIVEVDSVGDWWARHLNASSDGSFYDCPRGDPTKVANSEITSGHRVEGIGWGDLHAVEVDEEVKKVNWAPGGAIDKLRPKNQFYNDLLSMRNRNHHDVKKFGRNYEKWCLGQDVVEQEVEATRAVLHYAHRDFCKAVVVSSNHDRHGERWLDEANYKHDFPNVEFFLEAQLTRCRDFRLSAERGERSSWTFLEWALLRSECPEIRFLRLGESYVIGPRSHPVECGLHGDLGPNGSRGTTRNLRCMGRRTTKGHDHQGTIDGPVYSNGVCQLDMDYAQGPSSWTITHTVTWLNGKRAQLSQRAGKLWA